MEKLLILVGLETAKLAKEVGFDGETWDCFIQEDENWAETCYPHALNFNEDKIGVVEHISRPTQSELQKWIRDKHKISIKIDDFITEGRLAFDYELKDLGSQEPFEGSDPYNSYEEALENALLTSLAYIKDLNNDI